MAETKPRAAQQAYAQLVHRVATIPLPTVPPRYPYIGTSVGVGLLDAAINLNHVIRRIERLKIVDLTHLARDVTLHLSLDRLTPPQRAATEEYGRRREQTPSATDRPPILWVPITRVNRLFASPVRIIDSEGREVPRATQPELLPLINAAMYRLLRLMLIGQDESDDNAVPSENGDGGDGSLRRLLFERPRARWLLQQAVASMIYGTYQVRTYTDRLGGDDASADRAAALAVVENFLRPDKQAAFLELLHHASTEYLILAGLTSGKKEHYLSYNAAALPSRPSRWRWLGTVRSIRRGLSPFGCEFTLRYEAQLPPNLESLHVTLEAEGPTDIREALLVTETDGRRSDSVIERLTTLRTSGPDIPESIRRYQLGTALTDLSALVDARLNDADGYTLQFEHRNPRLRRTGMRRPIPNTDLVRLKQCLADIGHERLRNGSHEPELDITKLETSVPDLELGRDSAMDDDPRRHRAHIFWRRRRPSDPAPTTGDAAAEIQVVVADRMPPLARSVVAWLGMLVALVAVMGALVFAPMEWPLPNPLSDDQIGAAFPDRQEGEGEGDEPFPWVQSDALIAVLLIVPGWLLSRLGALPRISSLASRLRMLETLLAFLAVVTTAGLALIVATQMDNAILVYRSFVAALVALAGLLLVGAVERRASGWKANRSRLGLLDAPPWLQARPRLRRVRQALPLPRWDREARPRLRWERRPAHRPFDAEFESVAHWSAVQKLLQLAEQNHGLRSPDDVPARRRTIGARHA